MDFAEPGFTNGKHASCVDSPGVNASGSSNPNPPIAGIMCGHLPRCIPPISAVMCGLGLLECADPIVGCVCARSGSSDVDRVAADEHDAVRLAKGNLCQ